MEETAEEKPAKILVVDDDENIRKTLSAVLEAEGYEVDTAEDGLQAIAMNGRKVYNVALIDIRLPDMMGTELVSSIKETTPRMVKIIITGYPTVQNAVQALNKGVSGYVIKPFDVESLLNEVKKHLETQRKEKGITEERIAQYIETRSRELDNNE